MPLYSTKTRDCFLMKTWRALQMGSGERPAVTLTKCNKVLRARRSSVNSTEMYEASPTEVTFKASSSLLSMQWITSQTWRWVLNLHGKLLCLTWKKQNNCKQQSCGQSCFEASHQGCNVAVRRPEQVLNRCQRRRGFTMLNKLLLWEYSLPWNELTVANLNMFDIKPLDWSIFKVHTQKKKSVL